LVRARLHVETLHAQYFAPVAMSLRQALQLIHFMSTRYQ
jgi:hypothetical protein